VIGVSTLRSCHVIRRAPLLRSVVQNARISQVGSIMRFKSSLGAVGLVVAAVIAVSPLLAGAGSVALAVPNLN
jgi:hypothetical protein